MQDSVPASWNYSSAGLQRLQEEDQHDESEKVQPLSNSARASGSSFLEIYSTSSNLRQPVVYWGCSAIILSQENEATGNVVNWNLVLRDIMAETQEFLAASRGVLEAGSVFGMGRQKGLSFCSLIVGNFGIHLWQNITGDTSGKS